MSCGYEQINLQILVLLSLAEEMFTIWLSLDFVFEGEKGDWECHFKIL